MSGMPVVLVAYLAWVLYQGVFGFGEVSQFGFCLCFGFCFLRTFVYLRFIVRPLSILRLATRVYPMLSQYGALVHWAIAAWSFL